MSAALPSSVAGEWQWAGVIRRKKKAFVDPVQAISIVLALSRGPAPGRSSLPRMALPAQERGVRYLSAGLTLVVSAALFGIGGYALDSAVRTTPLFLVVGVLLGSAGGFLHLLRIAAPELLPFGRKGKTADDTGTSDSKADRRADRAAGDRDKR
jgi:hypothetical protein